MKAMKDWGKTELNREVLERNNIKDIYNFIFTYQIQVFEKR